MSIIALTSDTLAGTPVAGQVEYNGQFYGTDSNASRAQMQRITQGTSVVSTSGTAITFTGIPSWVKKVTLLLQGVSTTGTSPLIVQIGPSSGVETTGYLSGASGVGSAGTATTGFFLTNQAATSINHGAVVVYSFGSNTWVSSSNIGYSDVAGAQSGGGSKTLAGTLERISLTTVSGTPTFDAGSINILYEG